MTVILYGLAYLIIGILFAFMLNNNKENYGYGMFIMMFWPIIFVFLILFIIRMFIALLIGKPGNKEK